jgi:predicted ATPase with chaperone activity
LALNIECGKQAGRQSNDPNHSIAGRLEEKRGLVRTCPFGSRHDTISDAELISAGVIGRPGKVS